MKPALLLLLIAAQAIASGEQGDFRIAAPGLHAPGVDPKVAAFFSEHLAQQLAHQGFSVTTATEIATLLGLERQRQLLGCEDCQLELGGALGVRGIVQGTLLRSAAGYALRVRISDAEHAGTLAEGTRAAADEERLLEETAALARSLADHLLGPEGQSARRRGSLATFAQRQNVISFGPFHLLAGYYGVEYERALSDLFTLFIAPQLLHSPLLSARGFEVTLGARAYLFGEAPRGFHAGLYGVGGGGDGGLGLGVGAELGYQWLISNRVAISLGLGAGWRPLSGYLVPAQGDAPLVTRLRTHVGVAF